MFTEDLIEVWLDYKRTVELDQIRLCPHPHEFELYFDVYSERPRTRAAAGSRPVECAAAVPARQRESQSRPELVRHPAGSLASRISELRLGIELYRHGQDDI